MLLNVQWSKKLQHLYDAVEKEHIHIFKEAPVDALFAMTHNENSNFIQLHNITLYGIGIITNSNRIFEKCNIKKKTNHPYEIIIHIYLRYGMDYTLNIIEGYVSFVLIDNTDLESYPKIYVARDPLGTTPLWILSENTDMVMLDNKEKIHDHFIAISSNELYLKRLINLKNQSQCQRQYQCQYQCQYQRQYQRQNQRQNQYNETVQKLKIKQFRPGSYICYTHSEKTCTVWESKDKYIHYYSYPMSQYISIPHKQNISCSSDVHIIYLLGYFKNLMKECKYALNNDMSNVYFRLDGDVASIILLTIAKVFYKKTLKTFTCGPTNAPWFKEAKNISNAFSTEHIEISVLKNVSKEKEDSSYLSLNGNITKEKLEGYITARHLSKYTNVNCVMLPIGAHIWQQNNHADMWMNNKIMRENTIKYVSSKASVYMNEFWKQNIKTSAPFIDRKMIDIIVTLGMEHNIHVCGIIMRLGQLLGAASSLNNIKEVTDQSNEWEYVNNISETKIPLLGVVCKNNKKALLYC